MTRRYTRVGILILQVRGALECSFRDAIGGTLGGTIGCSFLGAIGCSFRDAIGGTLGGTIGCSFLNAIGGSKRRPDLRPARPRSLHKTAPSL